MTASPHALPFVQTLGDDIRVIDTGFHRPEFDAAYLITEHGRAAFVDTGTNHSVPRLLEALQSTGLARDAVDYVIVTHVHLDHAGGAGLLMSHLPEARLVVHPQGALHMIDPSRLTAGAKAVYGDREVDRTYGEILPVDARRVLRTEDKMSLELAGRPLQFLDTPGHARHHHCIWDERSRGFFTGDTFGLSFRMFDTEGGPWITPSMTPVQFEPEKMRQSVERLLSFEPSHMYLTHFGRVSDARRMAALLLDQMDRMVELALGLHDAPQRHEALKKGLLPIQLASLRAHGCSMKDAEIAQSLALDTELNAQGLGVWLDRRQRRGVGSP